MAPVNPSRNEHSREVRIDPATDHGQSFFPMYARAMIIGIILLIGLIHVGFFNTYIRYFPKFEDVNIVGYRMMHFNAVKHFHGIIMMAWVLMLLLQPILIISRKIKLHRLVGRLSYVLAPLVLLSIYLINQHAYNDILKNAGKSEAIAALALIFPAFVFFAILYFLAIRYTRYPRLHMRFMASTAFLFIPPALDRLLIYYFNLPGYDIGSIIELSIIGTVTLFDSVMTKRLSPFILVFAFEVLHKILWHSRESDFWQNIGGFIAKFL